MESRSRGWLYAAGVAVACAGVLVAGNVAFAGRNGSDSVAGFSAGAGPSAPVPTPTRSGDAGTPDPDPSDGSAQKPLGRVIDTGLAAKRGKWVLYAVAVEEKTLPKIHFGVMLGHRLGSGEVVGDIVTNETTGSDRSPGFHGAEGSMAVDAGQSPTFGYYAGPATRITGKSHGKTVTAKQATWSKDRSVVVYWFPASVTGVSGLKAYDKAGHVLPAGNTSIGVG
jgi:hypothetical protein